MKSLIVYDSWFGNTQKIAEAMADGLDGDVQVVCADCDPSRHLSDCELLIVGSPTHGGVATPAMQEFLDSINNDDLEGIAVAAFDTRVTFRWLKVIGFASKRIAKQLQEKGGSLIVPPQGFYVSGKKGPLRDGELLRARRWAASVSRQIQEAKV